MDQDKIGAFIADRRKMCGITQKQLAEKLGVSDKAVSKWENGKNMPDNSILLELCETLKVNVNELLSGEELSDDIYHKKAEANMVDLIERTESEIRKNKEALIGGIVGMIFLFVVIVGIVLFVAGEVSWYLDIASLLLLVVIVIIVLFVSGYIKDFMVASKLLVGNGSIDRESADRMCVSYKVVLTSLPIAGFIVTLVSIISICSRINDFDVFCRNLSVALLPVLYSLIMELFLIPVFVRLKTMSGKI
ncbi:MAG: helix-turn-helix transcriptional regulator [Lachnospira sp.]|nr:helix-turn-helix transcriptional regulator [Lachnospira sp.]